ncbi:MAG TPA: protein kinase [Bryobacteraceae bacterium]|jgi:tetratricopeptide (TPR) repeat protein/predicted Ser/Thr protein kinase|nr:protein kinase [Bryobacteraceae bacterium]
MQLSSEVESLFLELADLLPADRERYFDEHAVSAEVRREVEELLALSAQPDGDLHRLVESALEHAAAISAPLAPESECGPYRLLRILGRGGMGVVYLAERADGEVQQQVAIKLLNAGRQTPQALERFHQERQILADLSHENIARLLGAGHLSDGQPFLVMEYVEGQPIDAYCAALPMREKVVLLLQLCSAVSHAHRMLVIHRDLKPSNVLVTNEGVPKLLDFGIAKLIDTAGDLTITRDGALTPMYASPEQILGKQVGTSTDIYSLGALLYRIVTGRGPFPAGPTVNLAQLQTAVCETEPPRPRTVNSKIDRDLESIIQMAIRKEPEARYATVDRFAEDLRAWLEGQPVKARQGGWWYLARRYARRYWMPLSIAAAVVVSLTAAMLITVRERDTAQRRFNQVRQLASQMLAVERDLERVPGATQARERIVKTSLDYLESLSMDAGNDTDLKAELASAYRNIADIQGGFRGINLGRPAAAQTSLNKAVVLSQEVWKDRPNDPHAMRDVIDTLEIQTRIDYSQKHEAALAGHARQLQSLVTRYEPIAPSTADEWDFLGAMYGSLNSAYRDLNQYPLAMEAARRSIDYQRKALAAHDTPKARGNLAAALAAYGRMLRTQGDLDGALDVARQDTALLESVASATPNDFQLKTNLLVDYENIALIYGEADRIISLGLYRQAIPYYRRAIDIGNEALAADPKESQNRYNLGICYWKLGNTLMALDPRQALDAYDRALSTLRAMPAKMANRDLPIAIILAESTFPLRKLHREPEARARLTEAERIQELYKNTAPRSPGMPPEAISRAEADWALASGHSDQAIAIHRAWLERIGYARDRINIDLRDALLVARRYELLYDAYHAAQRNKEAADAREQAHGVLAFWRRNATSRKFVQSFENAMY